MDDAIENTLQYDNAKDLEEFQTAKPRFFSSFSNNTRIILRSK